MKRASRTGAVPVLLLCAGIAHGQSGDDLDGLFRIWLTGARNPENSAFNAVVGDHTVDQIADVRLNLAVRSGHWSGGADYQLIGFKGDTLKIARDIPEERVFAGSRVPSDRRRLLDLTRVVSEGDDAYLVQRLDRLWAGRTGEQGTVRIGRQAITWGNGLIYTPMDFFNPFDPAAVDRRYKPGDDMLYAQYAFASGDDLQGVAVVRRNLLSQDVSSDASTLAFKYHGFRTTSEFDLLLSQHYGDAIAAAGGNRELGGAVWRGDLVLTRTDDASVAQLVTSLSYSWTAWSKNMIGVVEYFYNGFGQGGGDYSPEALADNSELLERIARGELFTLGRHYVAANATVEITPLALLTPGLFVNLSDGSALFQAAAQIDLRQDLVLLGALNLPIGPDGTEFGGIPSGEPGRFLSTDVSLFLQLAAFF